MKKKENLIFNQDRVEISERIEAGKTIFIAENAVEQMQLNRKKSYNSNYLCIYFFDSGDVKFHPINRLSEIPVIDEVIPIPIKRLIINLSTGLMFDKSDDFRIFLRGKNKPNSFTMENVDYYSLVKIEKKLTKTQQIKKLKSEIKTITNINKSLINQQKEAISNSDIIRSNVDS